VIDRIRRKNKKGMFFLDSGAYSASTRGRIIVLQEYIDFIKDNREVIDIYANLDDLRSPEQTWRNQKEMERQGLSPLPVYHVGESMKFLKKAMKYEYFAIGGMANQGDKETRSQWFDKIFSIICPRSNNYLPTNRVHGFGMTSLPLMRRYPWYSVDSMTFLFTGRTGEVFVPLRRDGEWVYNDRPYRLKVSVLSTMNKGDHEKSIYGRSPKVVEMMFDYFESRGFELGRSSVRLVSKDYKLREGERWVVNRMGTKRKEKRRVEIVIKDGLCNNYKQRDELNILFMIEFGKSIPEYPRAFKTRARRLI
jgi:hypothetical protein